MAQSLIPFPPGDHRNVPMSRRWIAFRVIHKAGGPSWAVVDAASYELHPEASAYLHYLMGSARSTNTIRAYAQRLASFFTWLGPALLDWRNGVPVLSRFIRELAVTALPAPDDNVEYREPRYRSGKTINQYAAALTQFYMWAARSDLITEKTAAGFYETRIAYGYSGDRLLPGQVVRSRAVRVKEIEEAPKLIDGSGEESLLDGPGRLRHPRPSLQATTTEFRDYPAGRQDVCRALISVSSWMWRSASSLLSAMWRSASSRC